MSYLSYKIKSFFQDISFFFSLKYRSLKEEFRYECEVFEIRSGYGSVLRNVFLSKLFKTSATAIGGLAVVGFVAVEGGSYLFGKMNEGFSSVPMVEANVAPVKKQVLESTFVEEKAPEPVAERQAVEPTPAPQAVQQPEAVREEVAVKNIVPKMAYAAVPPEEHYIILVNKAEKTLKLAEFLDGKYFVVEEFDVSIGKLMGDKMAEGDLKTPVGKYRIIQVKKDSELHSQYGPFAFVLNYPNERDRSLGKTGDGIWIHGSGSNTRSPETKGCIELGNADLVRLRNYIQINTPVYIFPSDPIGMNDERIDLAAIDTLKNYLDTL